MTDPSFLILLSGPVRVRSPIYVFLLCEVFIFNKKEMLVIGFASKIYQYYTRIGDILKDFLIFFLIIPDAEYNIDIVYNKVKRPRF